MEIYIIIGLSVLLLLLLYLLIIKTIQCKKLKNNLYKSNKELSEFAADNINMEKELHNLQSSVDKQNKLADEIKSLHEKSRLLKHDMKNHMLVLLSNINAGKTEEAKNYISQIMDKLNKMYSYIYVGNSLINYILNNKLAKGYEKGLNIKTEIETLDFAYMESVDFSSLLCNILDNAIEASEKTKEKRVVINIFRKNGFDIIKVSNSIEKSVLDTNPNLDTTKSGENHGIGIRQIKSIVKKYNGMLDIYEKDNMFAVNVVYPV